MRFSKKVVLVAVVVSLFVVAAALAAPRVDMDDPRRSLGREDDVRVDAQLLQDTISPGSTIGINFQIQNLTEAPLAVAEKVCGASYDAGTQTITVAVGSEIPVDGTMPRLTVIPAGGKKTFSTGASVRIASSSVRSPFTSLPRYVQIKVSVLRNLAPFRALIERQSRAGKLVPVALSDDLFEQWIESSDTIFLNSVPIRFEPKARGAGAEAAERHSGFGLR